MKSILLAFLLFSNLALACEERPEVEELTNALSHVKISKPVKRRLFLGEADFSYTAALVRKHENTKNIIIATEFSSLDELKEKYPHTFLENLKIVQCPNVIIEFGVDATTLHQKYANRFNCIHFNFPHDGLNFKKNKQIIEDLPLANMIAKFFISARELQYEGDHIHVTLPHNPKLKNFYLGYMYRIFDASHDAGYILIKKHKFDSKRYKGYTHQTTVKKKKSPVGDDGGREYVFKKTSNLEIASYVPVQKKVYNQKRNILPELDTDEESSSYDE